MSNEKVDWRSGWLAACGLIAALIVSKLPLLLISWIFVQFRIAEPLIPNLSGMSAQFVLLRSLTLLTVCALAFVFWSSGRILSRFLKLESFSTLETFSIATALGCVFWGQLFLVLGLFGFLRLPALRLLLAGGAVAGIGDVLRSWPKPSDLRRELSDAGTHWLSLLGLHLLILMPYSFVPETYYDALEYHLALPALYLQRGRLGPVPENAFSGVPSLPSMLYGWSLALDASGIAAHALNFLFLLATLLAVLALSRRLNLARFGGAAAVLFALTPCVAMASERTGVELADAFFYTTAFLATLGAMTHRERSGAWLAAGMLAGAAMASKYLTWGLPAALFAAMWIAGQRKNLRPLCWSAAAAILVLGIWIIKNVVFYANPLYPFLYHYFRTASALDPGSSYLSAGSDYWRAGILSGLRIWLAAPFEALRYNSEFVQYASPALYGLLPAGIWRAYKSKSRWPLLAFALLAWLPISLASDLPRYLIPVYPALALIAAASLESAPLALHAMTFLCATTLAASIWLGGLPHSHLPVFDGRRSEVDFLEHSNESYYPSPLYAAARWIDQSTPRDARVLVFGDSRGFQLTRDYELTTPGQMTFLERWANSAQSGKDLAARIARERIGYILVNHAEILALNLTLSFSPSGKKALDQFWSRYTRKVFQSGPSATRFSNGQNAVDNWVVVYEVLSESAAAQPHPVDQLFAGYNVHETTR